MRNRSARRVLLSLSLTAACGSNDERDGDIGGPGGCAPRAEGSCPIAILDLVPAP